MDKVLGEMQMQPLVSQADTPDASGHADLLARYPQTREQALEILRMVVGTMARHAARPTPITYAVWFDHLGGTNAELSQQISSMLEQGAKLTDEDMMVLYERFVVALDAHVAQRVGHSLSQVMAQVSRSVRESSMATQTYQSALEHFHSGLHGQADAHELEQQAARMMASTQAFGHQMQSLDNVLNSSHQEVERLRHELQQTRDLVMKDALTGLQNRRGFDDALARHVDQARLNGTALALIMIDIDHFKQLNDDFGHLFGDRALKAVATAIATATGSVGVASRYGGEEFAILLPGASPSAAHALAERIRLAVSRLSIKRLDKNEAVGTLTVSAGVTTLREEESSHTFVDRADKALYDAKAQGRNRIQAR